MNLRTRILLITIPINIIAIISIYIIVKISAYDTVETVTKQHTSNLLNSATIAVKNQYNGLKYHKEYSTNLRKKERQQIIHIAKATIKTFYDEYQKGKLSEVEAKKQALIAISKFRFNEGNGYIWVNDTNMPVPNMLFHPIYPEFNGKSTADPIFYTSKDSTNILYLAVNACEEDGNGFIEYLWRKASEADSTHSKLKYSYVERFDEWQWILGTGIYLEDIELDYQKRLESIKKDLKQTMGKMELGKTGYFFIFNSDKEFILHPFLGEITNDSLDQLLSEAPFDDIMNASALPHKSHKYKWYSPLKEESKKDHYWKKVYVEYFEPLDWYICASFYYSELEKPGIVLGDKILLISVLFIFFSLISILYLSNSLTKPLNRLIRYVSTISKKDKSFQEVDLDKFPKLKSFEANALGKVIKEMFLSLRKQHDSLIIEKNKALDSENRYSMLFDKANDGIFLVKDGIITGCNDKACDDFLYSKDELIGMTVLDIYPEYQPDGVLTEIKEKEHIKRCLNGETQNYEIQHLRSNGELFYCSVSLSFIDIDDESYIQAIVRDITEKKNHELELEEYRKDLEQMVRKRTKELKNTNIALSEKNDILKQTLKNLQETQSQLIQSEKMASLGILTAGVAHEINNPLNYVKNGTVALQTKIDTDIPNYNKEYKFLFNAILTGIDKITAIVSSLGRYSHSQKTNSSLLNVNEILDNCLTMLHNQYKHKVTINKSYLESIPHIAANEGELHQIFLNILSNAIQAIPEKGIIEITSDKNDEFLIIKISDNGKGIKQEDLKHIFDPFFTTKEPGEGTGLGLSITKKLIEDHNGKIECISKPGDGATFVIYFPIIK